jgi:hypothetical protein
MDPSFDELRKAICSNDQEMKRFRSLVVNSVMATDIVDKEVRHDFFTRHYNSLVETVCVFVSGIEKLFFKAGVNKMSTGVNGARAWKRNFPLVTGLNSLFSIAISS